jgi:2-iminoacetate synthase ThiH
MQLKSYIKGVSCKYCGNKKTDKQKNNYLMRQKQIDKAEVLGKAHRFKKIDRV